MERPILDDDGTSQKLAYTLLLMPDKVMQYRRKLQQASM
jgi:hypothetical protein